MTEERMFKSLDEIKQYYIPIAHEKERIAKMTPAEFGKHIMQKILRESILPKEIKK